MTIVSGLLFRRVFANSSLRQIHLSARILSERYFTKKHEWVQLINNSKTNEVRVGISDYAQRALGDVVYCELPAVGAKFKTDDSFATLESVKAVSDCYMPVDGQVTVVNENLKAEADLINKSPYENGWLIQAVISDEHKTNLATKLMNEKQYTDFLETNKE